MRHHTAYVAGLFLIAAPWGSARASAGSIQLGLVVYNARLPPPDLGTVRPYIMRGSIVTQDFPGYPPRIPALDVNGINVLDRDNDGIDDVDDFTPGPISDDSIRCSGRAPLIFCRGGINPFISPGASGYVVGDVKVGAKPIPEPGAMVLFLAGLALVARAIRKP